MGTLVVDADYDGTVNSDGSSKDDTGTLGLISNNLANQTWRTFIRYPLTGVAGAAKVITALSYQLRLVSIGGSMGSGDGVEVHPFGGNPGSTDPQPLSGTTLYNNCYTGGTVYDTLVLSGAAVPGNVNRPLSATAVANANTNKDAGGFLAIGLSQSNLDFGDTARFAMLEHATENPPRLTITYTETHSGTIALNATGVLSAPAQGTFRGVTALGGSGALAATGATKFLAMAALAGAAALAAAATVTQAPLEGHFTGTAEISPEAHITADAAASFAGSGNASFLAGFKLYANASLAGSATMAPVYRFRHGGAADFDGSATIRPAGSMLRSSVDPNIQLGRAWAIIYDVDDTTLLGILPIIQPAQTVREVNKIGAFEFYIPELHDSIEYLEYGRYVRIYYEGAGLRFRGIIENWETLPSANGILMRRIWGSSLAAELAFENTYQGINVVNETASAGFTKLLARASAWTATTTGSYDNQSGRYDWFNLFEGAVRYAGFARGYVRETNTARELELKNTHAASGLVLGNVPQHTHLQADSPSIVPIKASPRFRTDGSKVFNRIIPLGSAEGSTFNLQESTRNSPYTIQSLLLNSPNPVHIISEANLGWTAGTTLLGKKPINVRGTNRLVVSLISINQDSTAFGVPTILAARLGGSMMQLLDSEAFAPEGAGAGYGTLYCFYALNPPVNPITDIAYELGAVADQSAMIYHTVMAFQDVDQVTPFRQSSFTSGSGTGTGTVSMGSAVAGDYILGRLQRHDSVGPGAATAGSGQINIANVVGNESRMDVSYRISAGAGNMSYTWSGTNAWAFAVLAIRPARTYYIEDSTSIAAHGGLPRVKVLPDIKLRVDSPDNAVALANTLYDHAVDFLGKHKDPVEFYAAQPDFLPDDEILPGDTCRFIFAGMVEESGTERRLWKQVDATFVIIAIREIMGDSIREWELTIATVLREMFNPDGTIANIIGDVGDLYDAAAT